MLHVLGGKAASCKLAMIDCMCITCPKEEKHERKGKKRLKRLNVTRQYSPTVVCEEVNDFAEQTEQRKLKKPRLQGS